MANPRDLAEQAFALLQSALRDSEARASDLDEQLKRKKSPKNRLEEQLDVLTHRIESVEAERIRWEQQAGHLEEVAEAERVKVAQLKKKLEIAESGPEKLTKKEVNFWRAKAEDFDTETKDYKDRLAALLREVMERDALIETLRGTPAAAPTTESEVVTPSTGEADDLRRQLEQRDHWLADLRQELHGLRAQGTAEPEPPLETLAEIETLRRQIASFELALTDAHNARAAIQADLGRAQHDLTERDRVVRETHATSERTRAALEEREHRIVQISAELEHLRTDLRQREQQQREGGAQRDEQIAALARDLDNLRSRAQQEQHDSAAAQAELGRLSAAISLAEQRNAHLSTEVGRLQNLLAERERTHGDAAAAAESLHGLIAERDGELTQARQQLEQRDGELEHSKTTAAANGRELTSLRETLLESNRELDLLRNNKHRLEAELSDVLTRIDTSMQDAAAQNQELAHLREHAATLQSQRDTAEAQQGTLQQQRDAAQEQISGLESELKEEREHAENLGELANERREHMTKLQEQLEEAEERYEEAKWRLGKAMYFERLVKRRTGLIAKLLAALRAKMKANVALKAGLDGLRTYKAGAEMNQQKLLQRIEALKTEFREAEEAVARHEGATFSREDLANSESRAVALEARLNTQAEIIQSLEADLKAARLLHKSDDDKHHDMERLLKELETKNQAIERLEADTDEQQRKLSKLRGSESETVRLKAMTEKDRSEIDALQREIAQLREALLRQGAGDGAPATGSDHTELQAKLKERENSVTRLMGTIKEHEATIKKLNETAESWKRKYQFLATDSPDAYRVAAEK